MIFFCNESKKVMQVVNDFMNGTIQLTVFVQFLRRWKSKRGVVKKKKQKNQEVSKKQYQKVMKDLFE